MWDLCPKGLNGLLTDQVSAVEHHEGQHVSQVLSRGPDLKNGMPDIKQSPSMSAIMVCHACHHLSLTARSGGIIA